MIELNQLNFHEAFKANPLIYAILPVGLIFIINDFFKVRYKNFKVTKNDLL